MEGASATASTHFRKRRGTENPLRYRDRLVLPKSHEATSIPLVREFKLFGEGMNRQTHNANLKPRNPPSLTAA